MNATGRHCFIFIGAPPNPYVDRSVNKCFCAPCTGAASNFGLNNLFFKVCHTSFCVSPHLSYQSLILNFFPCLIFFFETPISFRTSYSGRANLQSGLQKLQNNSLILILALIPPWKPAMLAGLSH